MTMHADTDTGADVTARALAAVEAARARADATDAAVDEMAARSDRGTTHWHGCEAEHPRCKVYAASAAARADVPLLAMIAAAAVRLVTKRQTNNEDDPWWIEYDIDSRHCVGCQEGAERFSLTSDFPHADDCPALELDAAIRAAGEAGQ